MGDEEFCLGFRLAGITRFFSIEEGLVDAFDNALNSEDIGILITLDEYFEELPSKLRIKCSKCNRPVFVVIGTSSDDTLREQIIRTVGVDLWKE